MKDVFEARENDLRTCGETFKCIPRQFGLLALINGQVVGLDLLSRSSAWASFGTAKLARIAGHRTLEWEAVY